VIENASLQLLSGFSSLVFVGEDFNVFNDPLLPTCQAMALLGQVMVGGAVQVFGNLPDACGG
jgi:hypothetical protein